MLYKTSPSLPDIDFEDNNIRVKTMKAACRGLHNKNIIKMRIPWWYKQSVWIQNVNLLIIQTFNKLLKNYMVDELLINHYSTMVI